MTWTSGEVEALVRERGLSARVVRLPETTHTAEDAARALGTDLAHIAKSLVSRLSDGRFTLAVLRGDQRLDRRKLCAAFGVRRMSLATAPEVLEVTGYPVGAVPPFPHRQALEGVIDPRVLEMDEVYCGGGETDALLRVPTSELLEVTGARLVDVALGPPSSPGDRA